MSDTPSIIERLRSAKEYQQAGIGYVVTGRRQPSKLEGEAADEIERLSVYALALREALQAMDEEFTAFDPDSSPSRHRMRLAVIKSRAALALKSPHSQTWRSPAGNPTT